MNLQPPGSDLTDSYTTVANGQSCGVWFGHRWCCRHGHLAFYPTVDSMVTLAIQA